MSLCPLCHTAVQNERILALIRKRSSEEPSQLVWLAKNTQQRYICRYWQEGKQSVNKTEPTRRWRALSVTYRNRYLYSNNRNAPLASLPSRHSLTHVGSPSDLMFQPHVQSPFFFIFKYCNYVLAV